MCCTMRIRVDNLVVIHIDTLRREYPYCFILKKAFEKLGYKVLLTSRRNSRFLCWIFSPKILILSHSFSLPQRYLHKLREFTDIYIIAVEVVGDESLMYPTDFPEYVDVSCFKGIFVWNEHYKNWLIQKRNAPKEIVYDSGSPRVCLCKYVDRGKKTKTIGFIGRFEFINTFYDAALPLEQILNMEEDRKHFLFRWLAEIEGAAIYRDLVDDLVKKGYKVSIRPHPQERVHTYDYFTKKYGEKVSINNDVDLIGWLEGIDVVIATLSTALTEAYILEKPIVVIDKIFQVNYMIHYEKWIETYMSVAHTPGSMEEIGSLLAKELPGGRKTKEMDEFLKRHYGIDENRGFDGLQNIIRIIRQTSYGQNPVSSSSRKYLLVRCFYLFVDIITLAVSFTRRRLYIDFQYNYCCFWNKPSEFMRKAASKFVADMGM